MAILVHNQCIFQQGPLQQQNGAALWRPRAPCPWCTPWWCTHTPHAQCETFTLDLYYLARCTCTPADIPLTLALTRQLHSNPWAHGGWLPCAGRPFLCPFRIKHFSGAMPCAWRFLHERATPRAPLPRPSRTLQSCGSRALGLGQRDAAGCDCACKGCLHLRSGHRWGSEDDVHHVHGGPHRCLNNMRPQPHGRQQRQTPSDPPATPDPAANPVLTVPERRAPCLRPTHAAPFAGCRGRLTVAGAPSVSPLFHARRPGGQSLP